MKRDRIEKEIREDWFKDHVAEFEKLNDRVSTLDWGKPGSSFYYCRYVFDGSKLYISGDIGEAIFRLTEKASIESITGYDIQYFHGKLASFCEDKYSFDSDTAIARIKEEIESIKEDMDYDTDYDDNDNEVETLADTDRNRKISNHISALNDLIEESHCCHSKGHWEYEVNQKYYDLTDYDPDVAEWIFSAGDVIPSRVHGYLIGLKMAYEQLKKKEVVS